VVDLTGYCRKYAGWLLRNYGRKRVVRDVDGELLLLVVGRKNKRRQSVRPRKYDQAVREQLVFIWDAFGLCGKRMKEAIVDLIPALIARGHFEGGSAVHKKLLEISAATIERFLKEERAKYGLKGISHTKASSILKAQIPIVISSELNTEEPGHYQIDLVGHEGGNPNGHFAFSLNAVELSSGWIEPRVVLNEAQRWTKEAMMSVKAEAPVPIVSLHSDNDSAFINERLQRWCAENRILYTRGRPYHSNDTCYIEQKNYDIVRQAVGYFRYETDEEIQLIGELYENLRPLVNFFLPSAKLIEKTRDGSRIRRRYDRPQSPFRRLLANEALATAVKIKLRAQRRALDPFELKANIGRIQDRLIELQKTKGTKILYPGPAYPQAGARLKQRLSG
jgi:hypothetical protein